MYRLSNLKPLNMLVTAAVLATLILGVLPISQAQAAPASIVVPVDNGWVKFFWSPAIRGAFTFSALSTSIDSSLLTLPARLTFTASAKVKCPATGDATVNVKVYDFNQLILSTAYKVICPAASTSAYPTLKSADDYLNDAHYFHGSVPIATGGAHNITIETDLATTDSTFWGYARIDTVPNAPDTDAIGAGAIALTVTNPPAGAWVSVQWGDVTGGQWTNIDTWSGPLAQNATGWMAYWVDAKDYGTGPYRWVVYTKDPQQGGQIWGVSDPFNFPRQKGDWAWSVVTGSQAAKTLSSIK